MPLFDTDADYAAFERALAEAIGCTGIRLAAYCVMPNHWRLLLWPRADDRLSETPRLLTVTHTQRWHAAHRTVGGGRSIRAF
jgi:putative transposase